ncbi:MAG: glycosyltransferase family 39 protein [Nitrospiraceae bacterium]|nr:MAG: glycosyltransferase family 39 protein [Nitrospiraceae bacterium]
MQFRVGDELKYHQWAISISKGNLIREHAFFTSPLYAYFLGLLYHTFGQSLLLIRSVNLILGLCSVVLTYLTAQLILKEKDAILATVIYGFCLPPIFYEFFAEKTSLVCFMTAVSLFLIVRALGRKDFLSWMISGLAVGLASLAHATLLILPPLAVFHLVIVDRQKWKQSLSLITAFSIGCIVSLSPATLHNYVADRDFVLIASNSGQSFYTGNHQENITGKYWAPSFAVASLAKEERDFHREAEKRTNRKLKPSESSRFWFRQGIYEIRNNPVLSVKRFLRKFRWAFNNEEVKDTRTFEFYKDRLPFFGAPLWGFGLPALLGLIGIVLTIKEKKFYLIHWFLICSALTLTLFFVYGRYRIIMLLPLCILSARTLAISYSSIKNRKILLLTGLLAACVILGWFVYGNVLPGYKETYFSDYYNQGNKYLNIDKKELAFIEYEKAIAASPEDEWLPLELSKIYLREGHYSRAETHLRRLIKKHPLHSAVNELLCYAISNNIDSDKNTVENTTNQCEQSYARFPKSLSLMLNLGGLYSYSGRYGKAEKIYRKAIQDYPGNGDPVLALSKLYAEKMGDIEKGLDIINKNLPDNSSYSKLFIWREHLITLKSEASHKKSKTE